MKGVPFYGYRVGYEFFTKIYLLNPLNMTRLADLLRQGAIMSKSFQPYESHMQYLAQWMCDYNLYGCAYIECSHAKFRSPIPSKAELDDQEYKWHDHTIRPEDVLDDILYPKQSHCSIEVDVRVADILNRNDIRPRDIHQDFIELKSPLATGVKLVQSMAGLWRDETKRRKDRMGLKDPSSSPFPPEVLVSVSADPRNTQPGGWIHEAEYREKIIDVIEDEKSKDDGLKLEFDNFVAHSRLESLVQTSLESVCDLYDESILRIKEARRLTQLSSPSSHPRPGAPQVDKTRLLSFLAENDLFDDDDVDHDLEDEAANSDESEDRKADRMPAPNKVQMSSQHEKSSAVKQAPFHSKPMSELTIAELIALGVDRITSQPKFEDAFEMEDDLLGDLDEERLLFKAGKSGPPQKKRRVGRSTTKPKQDIGLENDVDGKGSHNILEFMASSATADLRHKLLERQPQTGEQPSQNVGMNSGLHASVPIEWHLSQTARPPHTFLKPSSTSVDSNETARNKSSRQTSQSVSNHDNRSSKLRTKSSNGLGRVGPPAFMEPESQPSPTIRKMVKNIQAHLHISEEAPAFCFSSSPISASRVSEDLCSSRLSTVIYKTAYYSREADVPDRTREYAGREFRLESESISHLPAFDATSQSDAHRGKNLGTHVDKEIEERDFSRRRQACNLRGWEIKVSPPTFREVQEWLDSPSSSMEGPGRKITSFNAAADERNVSQIDYATQKNKHGFKYSQNKKSSKVRFENQYMSVMSLEVHVNTRGSFVPNPEEDEICCIFWALQSDNTPGNVNKHTSQSGVVVLLLNKELETRIRHQMSVDVLCETSELDLINRMVDIVRYWDPDIITGYEVHGSSWGYLIERARFKFDYDLCDEFSRVKTDSHGRFGKDEDRWGFNHTSTIRVTGRHMINIWRAMRGELNLTQYTMENVIFQQCHRRVPHYNFADLTEWYRSGKPRDLARVLDYFMSRAHLDLEILDQNELVPRTSEQARLLGVDFFSVFSRGSQFKVESLMFRIAKPENLLLPSPSRKQVGQQNALECLPLVMEPQSSFFNSPLLVLDFQSLYPSIMIAYNYCYSTCLGRVVSWRGQNKMGFTDYHRQPRILELLNNNINVAPNGIMYVKPSIRKSLLAKMLGEILETRVMVKSGMKVDEDDKSLQRLLNNRQLALKLIANVTYGYTSASFSGRMPCSEIADSIVQTGRETLEKAIALIHSVERWGADVVYGDTDSLFVYLKGRTKDEAFKIGQEIAKTVTDMNPRPIKLKFEKVYFPCVLLAKKRYVGFKYESKEQEHPDFDAKGIETIRRDGTPSAQKIEEKALKILFRTADLSQVKRYFQNQCEKIMRGRVSIQDFCFAKEVKLGTYSDKGPPPPGALISTKKMLLDPRAEPQYGERVPYVVIAGGPGARLIDRCVAPEALLHDDNTELDAEYYINKHLIPPLERIFNLMGANVRQWYDEMPKFQRIRRVDIAAAVPRKEAGLSKKTLESYMKSSSCLVCREKLEEETGICDRCAARSDLSLFDIQSRQCSVEQRLARLERICRSCANLPWGEEIQCDSKDCPVFYARCRQQAQLTSTLAVIAPLKSRLEDVGWKEDIMW